MLSVVASRSCCWPSPARFLCARAPRLVVTRYRTATVDGVELFYREAGPADARDCPAPRLSTSSHMFRNLIPALAERYRVIAPDYPAFGQSGVPDRGQFNYTFARFAELMDGLLSHLGAKRYALYVQDYGAPVGYRLALRHPERVTPHRAERQRLRRRPQGIRKPLKAYWASGSKAHREALRAGLTPAATKAQYVDGVREPSRVSPDTWLHDQALLERPGIDEIMLDLFKDYGSNVALYPQFQAFFRAHRPPTLIVWGKNDITFRPTAPILTFATCRTRSCTFSTPAIRPGGQRR